MTGLVEFALMTAAGNRFAVADTFDGSPFDDPGRAARSVCVGAGLDGLLLLAPPRREGGVRMTVYNADGSRAEACGNGLRCVALLASLAGRVPAGDVLVETGAGTRRVRLRKTGERSHVGSAEMGRPQIDEATTTLEIFGRRLEVAFVTVGNPHCVVFVDDVDATPVDELGSAIECHERFPTGTNVEFVALQEGALRARFWERGVGETRSCGTGACAAAVAAVRALRLHSPVSVETRGGRLIVEWDHHGALRLTGAVQRNGRVRVRRKD